jgi:hypothetical protein
MRRFVAVLLISLFLLAIPLSVAFGQGNQGQVDTILQQDEDIRGLTASNSINVDYLSQDQLRQKMIEDFQTEMPEQKLQDTQDMMVMLGYIPGGLDLEKLLIDLYTEQVAGFYDVKDKSMYLVSTEKDSMSAMDKYILSHELVHFLQDQNFNLNRPPFNDSDSPDKTDDDAATAATCLVEGDAQTTSDTWLATNMTASDLMDLQRESGQFSTKVMDSAPDYIRDGLMFPYEEGQSFVQYLKRKAGYGAINKAYQKPPSSTEQIYHPEKYTANEAPVEISLQDESGRLGESWKLAYENVLGEFDVYELFKPYFSDSNAREAAAGWGGNKYQYYNDDAGDKLLFQDYAWDSEKDAQEFSAGYMDYLKARFGSKLQSQDAVGAWQTWSAGGYQLALKKEGLNTYLLQSTSAEPFQAMMDIVGNAGDQIDSTALGDDVIKNTAPEHDYKWLVVGVVAGIFVLGIILLIVMLIVLRKPRTPPGPPGGPYYPGGGGGYYRPPGRWGAGTWSGSPPPPPSGWLPPPSGWQPPPPPQRPMPPQNQG